MSDFEGSDTGDRLIARRGPPTGDIFDEIDSAPLPVALPPARAPSGRQRTFEEDYLWRSWFVNNTRPADILHLFTRSNGHEIRNRNYYKARRRELRKTYGESPTEIQFNGYAIKRNGIVPEEIAKNFIAWLEKMGGRRPQGAVGGLLPVTSGPYGQGYEGHNFYLGKRTTGIGVVPGVEARGEPKITRDPAPVPSLEHGEMEQALKAVNGRRVARAVPEPSILADISSDEEPAVQLPTMPRVQSVLVPIQPQSPSEPTVPVTRVIPPAVQPLKKRVSPQDRLSKKRRLFGEDKPQAQSEPAPSEAAAKPVVQDETPHRARSFRRQKELDAAPEGGEVIEQIQTLVSPGPERSLEQVSERIPEQVLEELAGVEPKPTPTVDTPTATKEPHQSHTPEHVPEKEHEHEQEPLVHTDLPGAAQLDIVGDIPEVVMDGIPILTYEEELFYILQTARARFGPNGEYHPLVREALNELKKSAPDDIYQ